MGEAGGHIDVVQSPVLSKEQDDYDIGTVVGTTALLNKMRSKRPWGGVTLTGGPPPIITHSAFLVCCHSKAAHIRTNLPTVTSVPHQEQLGYC